MVKVVIGGYVHEGHSFAGGETDLDAFRSGGYLVEGAEMARLGYVRNGELNGIVDTLRDHVEFVHSVHGWANSGPPLVDGGYQYFEERILAAIRSAGKIDGVALVLHGASLAYDIDDPEGRLLQAIRQEVGPAVPVVATFDFHANVTQSRANAASGLVAYTTCPHTDLYETGARAASLLLDAIRGNTAPVVAMRKLPMIVPSPSMDTNHGPIVPVLAMARKLEGLPHVLSVSVCLAQPWLDVPDLGCSVTVVTDGRSELAQELADEVAMMLWDRRDEFLWRGTPVGEALEEALHSPPGMVVLADGADSPTAGSNGDSSELLRALVESPFPEPVLLTVVDPAAAQAAFAAGTGTEIEVSLGGARTPHLFTPVTVRALVVSLHDGEYWLEAQPRTANIGKTAVLRSGNITVVVSQEKPFMLDASVFHHAGLDPLDYRVVQVKSAGGLRAVFEPIAARIIDLDTAGPSSSNFSRLPFSRITRPLWPLDRNGAVFSGFLPVGRNSRGPAIGDGRQL
jgi:microcystin degradation protein MlrC